MLINKAIKVRIYPNKKQEEFFEINFNCTRFIYNKLLDIKTSYYLANKDNKEKLKQFKLPSEKELKKEFEFLTEADSISLQQANRDLFTAFQNYFRKLKEGKITKLTPEKLAKLNSKQFKTEVSRFIAYHPDYPQFKSKKDNHNSYRTFDSNKEFLLIDNKLNRIKLPKVGWIKFKHSHDISENIKSVTISKNPSNEYYASLLYENEENLNKLLEIKEEDCIGLDMSAKELAVASNDEIFTNEKFFRRTERRLKIRQRKLSKKEFGSNNRSKTKLIVAKTHQKIVNQKDYFLHSLTKHLSDKYNAIFVEDLNIKGMQKFNSGLSKTVSQDLSWSKFVSMLNYKMNWKGKYLIKIDRWFPSSKLCSVCGQINNDLTLVDRSWTCDCGTFHDRDKNAAINILKEGINLLKNSTVVITESYASRDMNVVLNTSA
jgi:putative transposase